jgi:signal transduction histidine kinase
MLRKLVHKFYLIGGFLGILFVIGYAQLAFFLRSESRSAMRGQGAVLIEREFHSLEETFRRIRFWERAVLSQDHPEADKTFGTLMEQMHRRLGTMKAKPIGEEMTQGLGQISDLVTQYEREFNQIIQLKTEQRLGQTLLDSNYQSLISNILRSNEINLLRPLFNLSHFQGSYLSNHRESEYQALKVVMESLENKLRRMGLMDERLKGYTETYKELLDRDFSLEKGAQELSDHFDEISSMLASNFQHISKIAEGIRRTEVRTAENLRKRLNQSFIISMALGTIGVLIIFIFVARQIVNPIGTIAEVARSVRSGDTDARFVPTGNQRDEVVQLGWDLNEMLDTLDKKNEQLFSYQKELESKIEQLAGREDELQKHRDHLEELVEERTRELQTAHEELIHRERLAALGQLTAVVSHELRNPLGTIRSSLFTVRERVRGKGFGVEPALDRAERNIARSDRIIEDLLDYTRARELDRQFTVIDEWLDELLDDQTETSGVPIARDLAAGVKIQVDRERLRRCVINVINNAKEALTDKEGFHEVGQLGAGEPLIAQTRVNGDRLEIRVIDAGPGIPQDELGRIFEPLYSTKTFGAGLGLPIVKQIMEQHGGGIEIKNEPDGGVAATLWLPMPC